jgi:hypothetical protein
MVHLFSRVEVDVHRLETRLRPGCRGCHGPLQLLGIDRHPVRRWTAVRSFVCLECERVEVDVLPNHIQL